MNLWFTTSGVSLVNPVRTSSFILRFGHCGSRTWSVRRRGDSYGGRRSF